MARTVKTLRRTSAARQPLISCLKGVQRAKASTWPAIESDFLAAMELYDAVVAAGQASDGDIRNGKGDFFNDVLVALLENASGQALHTRPKVPGLVFPENRLDAAYPETGLVSWMLETKAVGVPRHPKNTRQTNAEGRPGSADIDKRIKEAAWKTIDIKGETARLAGQGGGATSDLSSWIRSAPPRSYLCLSARVTDDNDLAKTVQQARRAKELFDGVGLVCFGWDKDHGHYESKDLGDNTIELDRVLSVMATSLRITPAQPAAQSAQQAPPGP